MRILMLAVIMLLSLSLTAQSEPISFEDLDRKNSEDGVPVYYLNGQPFSGKTYDFYEQENVSVEHYLDNGLLTLKEGFRKEQKIEEAKFKEGLLDGIYLKYFDNGQKYVEHRYQNGKMHGMQYGWEKDGSLRLVTEYDNGIEKMRMKYPPPGGFETLIKN